MSSSNTLTANILAGMQVHGTVVSCIASGQVSPGSDLCLEVMVRVTREQQMVALRPRAIFMPSTCSAEKRYRTAAPLIHQPAAGLLKIILMQEGVSFYQGLHDLKVSAC